MFMICCDKCSDWFHGRCVKITRSMARELIDNGLDFICPKCVRQEQGLESPPKREVWNLVISEKLNVLYIFFEYFIYVYEKKRIDILMSDTVNLRLKKLFRLMMTSTV